MKGLPLAYQKDMQEDKEGTIEALSALMLSIAAMTGMVRDMLPDANRMREAADEGYSTATDLADWLVQTLKMPFRDAHHVTGPDRGPGGLREGRAPPPAAPRDADHRAAHHQGRVRRCSRPTIR